MKARSSFTWQNESLSVTVSAENNHLVFNFKKSGQTKSAYDFVEFLQTTDISHEEFYELMSTGFVEGFLDPGQFEFVITATNYYFKCKANGTLDKFLESHKKLKALRPDSETKEATKWVDHLLKELKIKKSRE